MPYERAREYYLTGLCLVYFTAIASSFIQYPGLFSEHGITPIANGEWHRSDLAMFALHIIGMIISLMIGLRVFLSGNVVIILPIIYALIINRARQVDAPFFNFQWDLLLIETGVISSLWLVKTAEGESPPRSASWALRFLAFKLMFSAGVVKLTANDPTWLNLRALHYHFASQPLPTPLAWFAHQLPDWALIFGTASAIWIEIPLAIFLLSPIPLLRLLAVFFTTVLMIVISLTGNYNFFNLLTVILMIPLTNGDDVRQPKVHLRPINIVGAIIGLGALLSCTMQTFEFKLDQNQPIKLLLTPHELNEYVNWIVPLSIAWTLFFLVAGTIMDLIESWRDDEARIFHLRAAVGVLSVFVVVMCAVPMAFSLMTDRSSLQLVPNKVLEGYTVIGKEFSSSYGLFRTMTGVGRDGKVRVPTALLDLIEADTGNIQPVVFRYYAREDNSLSFVQPHQPRIDWQMWFAALTRSPQSERWFVNFCRKVVEGERAVWNLLSPSIHDAHNRTYKSIKLSKVDYDFTRDSKSPRWWQKVDGSSPIPIYEFKNTKVKEEKTNEPPLIRFWIDYGRMIPMTLGVMFYSLRRQLRRQRQQR